MGIRFEAVHSTPFLREFADTIYDWKPLYLDGRWNIFFNGCPCRRDGDIGKASFLVNLSKHRNHLLLKIHEVYGVEVEKEALLNGSGTLGGLAKHVEKLYRSSGSLRERQEKEKETARVQRLQDAALRLHRMGVLRILPSGDIPADRTDCIYREAEREGSLPGLDHPERSSSRRNA